MNDLKFDICGFEHLHLHTMFSLLDGLQTPDEAAITAIGNNQQFLCITDHGMMGAIPSQIRACDKHKLTPLFGIELYVNDFQPSIQKDSEYKQYVAGCNEADRNRLKKSYHLLAIAKSDIGYSNLVNLSTWSYAFGYGGNPRRPRVTHEQLIKHKEGIVFTSCCYLSEIGQAFDTKGPEAAEDMLRRYYGMFGDNFYLELMMLDFKKQKPYDAWLISMHDKYHIPLTLSQDCHYAQKEHSKYQRYMLMTRTKNTVQDIERALAEGDATERFFELQDQNLWMKSEGELDEKWLSDYKHIIPYDLYCQAKSNTVKIAESAKGVQIDRSIKLPKIENDKEKLWEELVKGFRWRALTDKVRYMKQLREEYDLLCRKDFASYFLITKMAVDEARRMCPKILGWGNGNEAIAPGRGSSVGFLTCYVLGITDIDPIKHNLLPERFLSDGRGGRQLKLEFDSDPI